jgi:hypothetical protein
LFAQAVNKQLNLIPQDPGRNCSQRLATMSLVALESELACAPQSLARYST